MLSPYRVLALLIMSFWPHAAAADDTSLALKLDEIRRNSGLPALAAAVTRGDRIVAQAAVGSRVLNADLPVTINDRFHIGSDTKAMTATLAGMMIDEGKLRWTSTVGEILGPIIPGLGPEFSAITLEQLLSHTSGIPSDTEEIMKLYYSADAYDDTPAGYRKQIIAEWAKSHTPKVPEGSPFQYANLGYVVAGAMIEAAAGQPWDQLITQRIFGPLGLASAGLGPQATFGKLDAAVGHMVTDTGVIKPMPWGPAADGPAVIGPAGIVHMSVLDFARWAAWNAGGGKRGPPLVKPETLQRIHRPHVSMTIPDPKPGTPKSGEYALGWGIMKMQWSRTPVLTHNGSNSLNLATILVDSNQDMGIVVMTNFPGRKADAALLEASEYLYTRFSSVPAADQR